MSPDVSKRDEWKEQSEYGTNDLINPVSNKDCIGIGQPQLWVAAIMLVITSYEYIDTNRGTIG